MSTKRKRSSQKAEKPLVATIIKNIGGVNVTLSKNIEHLTEDELVAAAERAISRLETEKGEPGLVIITSFSHTAIIGEIEGAIDDTFLQRHHVIKTIGNDQPVSSEPASVGASLKKVACFSIPSDLNLHKLNIAGIGAKSFVSTKYIREIVDIIKKQQHPQGLTPTPESIATRMITDIVDNVLPRFTEEATKEFKPYTDYRFDAIRNLIESELKKTSKRNPTVLTFQHLSKAAQKNVTEKTHHKPLIDAVSYQFHYENLQSGAAFTQSTQRGSCMMNKEYLRYDSVDEHIPGPDWHINVYDKTGNHLIDNISGTTDPSWMMDLITLVKILKRSDKVTTKDILDLLYDNGIRNVVFIDGGCNVFCGDGGMLACSGCHPSLDILCDTCGKRVGSHSFGGGMKNKKLKPTKKKAIIVRTVRGRRMRKSYKRYKRYKTYKRSKTYKR
jgi:hypothetical protein